MEHRTYRYMTEEPLYPFGYGLSYSDFKYTDGKYDNSKQTFTFRIENGSDRDGEEVAQLYLTNKGDKKSPVKTLVGFERVVVPAGKSVWVSFQVDDDFFQTYVDEYQHFESHPGTFVFHYGDQEIEIRR